MQVAQLAEGIYLLFIYLFIARLIQTLSLPQQWGITTPE